MRTHNLNSPAILTDHELISRVTDLTRHERTATAKLVEHIAEFDRRRLYLGEGCSSMFSYCTQILHLSEHEAYSRIKAGRFIRRYPSVLKELAEGSLHLTAICLLAPVITDENLNHLIQAARHKSKVEILEILAKMRPQEPAPTSIRRVPSSVSRGGVTPAGPDSSPDAGELFPGHSMTATPLPSSPLAPPGRRQPSVTPLSEETYRIQFTASAETRETLRELQDLLRHQIKDGDPAVIMDMALTLLLREVKRKKLAAVPPRATRPSGGSEGIATDRVITTTRTAKPRSRTIPAEVKRHVWARDQGRCAFRSRGGRRCAERSRIEFHHRTPFAAGGSSSVENIELRCSNHNAYEAELYFEAWTSPGPAPPRERFALNLQGSDRATVVATRSGTS